MDHKEYIKLRYHTLRKAWIASQGDKCVKCGSTENLEVDHIDPKLKTMHATDIWKSHKDKRDKELAQCQVLCNPCHIEKSNKEKLQGTQWKHAKLSEDIVLEIRCLYNTGNYTHRQLAGMYGVTKNAITELLQRKTWKHI